MDDGRPLPLDGIRVLDFSQITLGPIAGTPANWYPPETLAARICGFCSRRRLSSTMCFSGSRPVFW